MKLRYLLMVVVATFAISNVSVAKDWGSKSVCSIKTVKVMKGYPDGSFKENNFATRKEMAVALDRVVKINENTKSNVYIVNPLEGKLVIVEIATLFLLLGLIVGYLIAGRKIEVKPIIEVKTPEINPVINISGMVGSDGNSYKNCNGTIVGKEQEYTFQEEKYRPTPATFKSNLTEGSESQVQTQEREGRDNSSDLDKLKKFMQKEGK